MTNKRKSLIGGTNGTKGNKGRRLSSVPVSSSHKRACFDIEPSQEEVGFEGGIGGLGQGRLRKEAWMDI